MNHPESNASGDLPMLEIFRSEVEKYTGTLTEGLLALENEPADTSGFVEMMRAAHSIKGGARIVEQETAIRIAHTLEDCFVAVRENHMQLSAGQIDILLEGVDAITRIADAAVSGEPPPLSESGVGKLTARIAAITGSAAAAESPETDSGEPPVSEPVPEPPPTEPPGETISPETPAAEDTPVPDPAEIHAPEPPPVPEPSPPASVSSVETEPPPPSGGTHFPTESRHERGGESDRMVRVTAGKIERLMGLAGEVVVSTRWLPPFFDDLLTLKRSQSELSGILDELQRILAREVEEAGLKGYTDGGRGQAHYGPAWKMAVQAREKARMCSEQLASRLGRLDQFISTATAISDRLYHEVIGVRMCPFADGVRGRPRMIRDLARQLGKRVQLQVFGESTEVDRDILEKLDAPLNHLLRNAVAHGIEPPEERAKTGKPEIGIIRLEAVHRSGMLMIIVADDGRGINPDWLRRHLVSRGLVDRETSAKLSEPELLDFLFLPGFTTTRDVTEISGRGVGLDVVHTAVHEVGGVVRAETTPGKGLRFHLELPLTLSVIRTFLVNVADEPYAFPLARIDRCLRIEESEIVVVEGRQYFRIDERNVALVDIREVLEIEDGESNPSRTQFNVVMVSDRTHAYGLVVDEFIGEHELVVRPLDPRLGKVPDISAASVMMDGSPVLIFDVEDLVRSIDNLLAGTGRLRQIESRQGAGPAERQARRVLVVDDSFIVREKERKLLESKGYSVELAVDGMDGWNRVRTAPFDMVITDIDMPRMNGFELIRNIKRHNTLKSLPVIVVSYKASEEDRLQGLEAGANYYLAKTDFDDYALIEAVVDLIGEA